MGEFNQAKYIQEYQKENYDRCIFNVPKGQKATIKAHYEELGYKSLNEYVNSLIRADMAIREALQEVGKRAEIHGDIASQNIRK